MRVLSTKKLKINQRDLLINAGFSVMDYDAIKIEFLEFETPSSIENAIFTSQNGVRSFLARYPEGKKRIIMPNCFCVGSKTKALLEKIGFNVVKCASYAAELGKYIVQNSKGETFHFFCGDQRRDDIPEILADANVALVEITTYRTVAQPTRFRHTFDGILFYSPSGVESYFQANPTNKDNKNKTSPKLFCIGKTTANAAKKYSNRTVIANATSVESVIAKAAKTLRNYDKERSIFKSPKR